MCPGQRVSIKALPPTHREAKYHYALHDDEPAINCHNRRTDAVAMLASVLRLASPAAHSHTR